MREREKYVVQERGRERKIEERGHAEHEGPQGCAPISVTLEVKGEAGLGGRKSVPLTTTTSTHPLPPPPIFIPYFNTAPLTRIVLHTPLVTLFLKS